MLMAAKTWHVMLLFAGHQAAWLHTEAGRRDLLLAGLPVLPADGEDCQGAEQGGGPQAERGEL